MKLHAIESATDFSLAQLDEAAELVYAAVSPTPQYRWPLLEQRAGAELWLKHENHTQVGAFKIRGGIVYMRHLKELRPALSGVITATRGNHGQSVAFSARTNGLSATIVVPHGNSVEKNAAMLALGAELIEFGQDYQASREHAQRLSRERGLHFVPPFHEDLVRGVASFALEFLRNTPQLERVYVPIGMGSGVCAMIAARDALGLQTKIVGVVAKGAPAYALSFQERSVVTTETSETMADGLACRTPDDGALQIMLRGLERVVTVGDDEITRAMRVLFSDTHNVAEGAGAASLAAVLREAPHDKKSRIGAVITGGNVDAQTFASVLNNAPQ
jgi:threonine dehydratase